jgi:cellulose synthase/poly-beta-1,6-N-acetylglucosamine synthase-like glycosyltransferase
MHLLTGAVLALYFGALGALSVYGVHRLTLAMIRLRRRGWPTPGAIPPPAVTVQIPVYNEIHVLDRLVEAACSLRHPRSLLQVQILDDSTDATSARAEELAAAFRARGVDVACLRRGSRAGFKAGALAAGLASARGEFIAVFDADFVPPPDFLEKALPHFADPRVGMVQARWGHLNRTCSLLTRAQALMLDGHFAVEQAARAASGRYFNFNGTAGVFRRACIEEAGGWQADTLTEDLDISYRAQMKGWRFVYLDDLVCPAELPAEFNALRQQQRRWAKGSIQTARKLLPALLASAAPARVKVEAFFHLTNNAAYPLLLLASILLVPSLLVRRGMGWGSALPDLLAFVLGTGSFAAFCLAARRGPPRRVAEAAAEVPAVMLLGAGLALNNTLGVLEALAGIPSEFRRTPKLGVVEPGRRGRPERAGRRGRPGPLYRGDPTRLWASEAALAAFFAGAALWAGRAELYGSLPFLALLAAGYAYAAGLTLVQGLAGRARA